MELTSKKEMSGYHNPYLEEIDEKLRTQPKGRFQYAVVMNFTINGMQDAYVDEIVEKYTALGWRMRGLIIGDFDGKRRICFNFS